MGAVVQGYEIGDNCLYIQRKMSHNIILVYGGAIWDSYYFLNYGFEWVYGIYMGEEANRPQDIAYGGCLSAYSIM